MSRPVDGILLLFHHPMKADASTIMEHVDAFSRYSGYPVWKVNVELGFPAGLHDLRFRVILLHYSLFGSWPFLLNNKFRQYLAHDSSGSLKIAFFQDEYQHCQSRFELVNQMGIDTVFTLLEPEHIAATYGRYTHAKSVISCVPGYVSPTLLEYASQYALPRERREIDVGYRARQLPFWMGKGSQEKHEIALRFQEYARSTPLRLDISSDDARRLYGIRWHRFLGNCRAVLGVEAGVSVFDLEDVIRKRLDQLPASMQAGNFGDFANQVGLAEWEDRVPYRTISPRHFEAAAFRCCQVLYEGHYSGILRPELHYLPLRRDFANFAWIVEQLNNESLCRRMTDACYQDLIAGGRYDYECFVQSQFDPVLAKAGVKPAPVQPREGQVIAAVLRQGHFVRMCYAIVLRAAYCQFPGRSILYAVLGNYMKHWRQRKLRGSRAETGPGDRG